MDGYFKECSSCPHMEECLEKHWALTFDINGHQCDHYLRSIEDKSRDES